MRYLPVNAYERDQGNVCEYDNYVDLRQFRKGKDVRALIVAGTLVCHSVHGGGGSSVPACTTGHMTRGLCPGGLSLWDLCPEGDLCPLVLCQPPHRDLYGNEREVCILLECIVVLSEEMLH